MVGARGKRRSQGHWGHSKDHVRLGVHLLQYPDRLVNVVVVLGIFRAAKFAPQAATAAVAWNGANRAIVVLLEKNLGQSERDNH